MGACERELGDLWEEAVLVQGRHGGGGRALIRVISGGMGKGEGCSVRFERSQQSC